jgi:NitT/TauT family transport system permease protein
MRYDFLKLLRPKKPIEPPYALIALVLIIGFWQFACSVLGVSTFLLPAPLAIAKDIVANWAYFLPHIGMTAAEVLIGFLASVAVGIPIAVLLTFSRVLNKALYPLIVGSQVVPKVAIAPVMLAWFGFGMAPKIAIIITVAFFPVVINAVVGLSSASPQMIYLARSMGASPLQMFWKFRLPQALPSIMAGVKMAAVLAVIGAVVAEFVGSDSGLGHVILSASSNFDITRQFSAIILLTLLGMLFFWATEVIEFFAVPWHVSKREQG